jgi:hypothetical protein
LIAYLNLNPNLSLSLKKESLLGNLLESHGMRNGWGIDRLKNK